MRWRGQDGSLSAEFIAAVPLLVIVAIMGWQLLTIVSAGSVASNAARNGSRAVSTGEDVCHTVLRSLPEWLTDTDGPLDPCDDAGHPQAPYPHVVRNGTRVTVTVEVPNIFRAVPWDPVRISRSAELPDTS